MKATIDFDDQLYRRLKIEAAKRGRTVRELVAEGVQYVLDGPPNERRDEEVRREADEWKPAWFGSLRAYAKGVDDHSMPAIRRSIDSGRLKEGEEA